MMKKKISLHKEIFILFFLVMISFLVRMEQIKRPIVDLHSWKQTQTYQVARNFWAEEFNILRPRINLISPDTRGEMTYREELPLYQLLLAGLFKLFGESLILARLYSILLMALTTLAIYLIGRSIFSPGVGFASALVFNLFPASVFWGRTILPELMALFLSTLAILLVLFRQSYLSLVGFILLGLAVAIKPYFMVLILPLVYFLITTGRKDKWYVNFFKIIVAVFITVFPYILWQLYWRSQPEDAFLSHSILSGRGFELLWRNAPPCYFLKKQDG